MKTSKALGKKWSEGRKKRHRDSMARLKAEGRVFGVARHPSTHVEKRICQLPTCGVTFPFLVRPATDPKVGRYCRQNHAILHVSILRMKVPDDYNLLFDLYVTKRMSTPEIGEMFHTTHGAARHRLKYLGILRRKVGHSRHVICSEENCDDPVFKIKHPQNGSMYGTKCERHYWEHRKSLHAHYYVRKQQARGNIPDAICRVLGVDIKSSAEIAEELGTTTKVVSTTIGHLRRRGKVTPAGTFTPETDRVKRLLWKVVEAENEMAA